MSVAAHTHAGGEPLVLFIAGTGRSGSTLLGNALGTLPGCWHAGEASFLLGQFDAGNRICGCGRTIEQCATSEREPRRWCPRVCGCGQELRRCELWREIQARAFHGAAPLDLAELAELGRFSVSGMRYTPRSWLRIRRQAGMRAPAEPVAERYAGALRRIYLATAQASGAQVVIDSSKLAMHVYLGARFAAVRAHVVHLARDPRAIAYSWQRRASDEVISGPLRASMNWVASNLAVRQLERAGDVDYTFIRYEDFIRAPRAVLTDLAGRIGLDARALPFADEQTLRMQPNHAVAGSPSRFASGEVTLAPDEEWRERMRLRDRVLATLPATPFLHSFGYAVTSPLGAGR